MTDPISIVAIGASVLLTLGLAGPRSLEEEIAELRSADAVDAELDAMKAALAAAK